ncbi:hypothetical protein SAMN05892883_2568 [Jatrophihabitans sp. GAS493]|uniref:hypothetical protein n=1 Tax=Jatrophihabitans sp. GAS493 TaxID=1907575 RepID=UPI000BC000DC|nr:hypothetical protein [Jatrophihabitans sp. GAS493]SOD73277.1 hypothetical protein SAMN05892883_2568 [Jatrophihabitans sp. GAS493]
MTEDVSGQDLHVLSGPTSIRFMIWGTSMVFASGLGVFPLGVESYLGKYENLYIAVILCIIVPLFVTGIAVWGWGLRKQHLEILAGYTVSTKVGAQHPSLAAVDARTRAIIRVPEESPADGSRMIWPES